ncbi:alpha-hydroxyketone-type quorum-sensing autoinducer synthase [Actinomadura fulvescens]|uniref:8-amino-7-oxononanoate synthase n=1 Tax=Actinomadura fulvescens TaxID=46160 RepID=A0ABP6CD51_9ACTN
MVNARQRLDARIEDFHGGRVRRTWGGRRLLDSRAPGRDAIVLTSNDYLAIADHPQIAQATADHRDGPVLMSAIFLRDEHPQLRLAADFARHMGTAAGVLCPSGWSANTGLLQVIADKDVPVYIDVLAHMSLWEGARAAQAPIIHFRHNDPEHLRRRLERNGSGVIVVDSVYSTDGSVSPLAQMVTLAREFGCVLVVDESHSLGTHGEHGAGMVAELGLTGQVDFQTASLAKAIPGRAGLIVCDRPEFTDYFAYTALPAIFSSTLLPHDLARLAGALQVVRDEGWRRDRLRHITRRLRTGLTDLGYHLGDHATQILALEAGTEADTMLLRDSLARRGVFGSAFFPPATSPHRTLVRLSLHAALTDDDIDRILTTSQDIRGEVGMAAWPSTRKRAARNSGDADSR